MNLLTFFNIPKLHTFISFQLFVIVEVFMSRDDNCRMQPGKVIVINISKEEKKQRIVLTNYLT